MKKLILSILLVLCFSMAFPQKDTLKVIVKSNLVALAVTYPNITLETVISKHGSLVFGYSKNIRRNFPDQFLWIDYRQYILSKHKLKGGYLAPGYFVGLGNSWPLHSLGGNVGFQVYNSSKKKHIVLDINAGMYKNLKPIPDGYIDFFPKLTIAVGYIFGK
ncbi:hypothetical protein EGI26_07905 [Lacihabitans sp. CCS-44]|uniref:DUF3575 domain-containing protein n=1 Tax=Lacihabitans sp. CCS-44 TaxID=2487331 RepID=UPI0020CC31F2|nr:DUF3575 domain-containing protein [Lacihabitans sp. CCS-44]MCP9755076.1 hypothetical protein [Lacihabitans sp. CCS-44]